LNAGSERADSRAARARPAPGRVRPLHPFLFAAASVLAQMAFNLNQIAPRDVAGALAGALGFAGAVYLAVAAMRRRRDATTAVIASIWVVGCLFFAELFGRLNLPLGGVIPSGDSLVRVLPVALAAMAVLSFAAARLGRGALAVHTALNGVAAVMVAMPVWQTVTWEMRHGAARAVYDAERAAAEMPQIAAGTPAGAARSPDIYHFIFDRLASDASLEAYYGVEGTIGRFLADHGFYVAEASNANYLKTAPSVASTLYMDYLDFLGNDPRVKGENYHPIFEMLDDHRAARFLEARGYEFVQFGAWWRGTYDSPQADENHPIGFGEFDMNYLRSTVLRPIFHLLPDVPWTRRLDWDNGQCQRVARQAEMIKAAGQRDRPVYVFAHLLLPHGPDVFTPEGDCLTFRQSAERGYPQGYIDQVAYAGKLIEDMVTSLQAQENPPIILIQADEGPFPARDYSVAWQDAPADELREKTAILNAYYFPNGDYELLRPDITPVNSYRVLFDTYFGADLPLLPDRIWAFPFDAELYEYHDVTALVRGDTARIGRTR
jgi:hypothetical protein